MRAVSRVGGKAFRPPANRERATSPLDLLENLPNINSLDVAPRLEPINDEFSVSDPFEPVDARDCAKYPASPYCEGDLFRFGPPVGFDVDIRINNCTICVYIYPVVGWMRLTPTIICRRDPNCEEDNPPPISRRERKKDDLPNFDLPTTQGCWTSAYFLTLVENRDTQPTSRAFSVAEDLNISSLFDGYLGLYDRRRYVYSTPNKPSVEVVISTYLFRQGEKDIFVDVIGYYAPIAPRYVVGSSEQEFRQQIKQIYELLPLSLEELLYGEENFSIAKTKLNFELSFENGCPNDPTKIKPPSPPPPPPPPPFGKDDDRKKGGNGKKGGKDCMCCNDCRDSKDNTDQLLRELRVIRKILGSGKLQQALNAAVGIGDDSITGILETVSKRIGISSYPIEVPESLLQGVGDKTLKVQSNADFLYWLTTQFDALVGQFPIEIQIQDIDPLTEGDQKKKISLPNIAEAVAEMYGLTIKNSVNQEVELNMLLRLAAEVIATKNAAVVTQDYARANANFLGYKANYKARELQYNFDFSGANLDPKAKEPVILEKLLKTVTGYVQGWQLEDKETAVGFLQKLMFSAGIIKAVFFRGKGNQKELNREINSMSNDEKSQEKRFEQFIKEINDPNSKFNRDTDDKPIIRDETPPDTKGAK